MAREERLMVGMKETKRKIPNTAVSGRVSFQPFFPCLLLKAEVRPLRISLQQPRNSPGAAGWAFHKDSSPVRGESLRGSCWEGAGQLSCSSSGLCALSPTGTAGVVLQGKRGRRGGKWLRNNLSITRLPRGAAAAAALPSAWEARRAVLPSPPRRSITRKWQRATWGRDICSYLSPHPGGSGGCR